MPSPPLSRDYFLTDADSGSAAFGAITGTTTANATVLFTLTQNRRQLFFTNTTDKPVLVARKRVDGTGNPVYFDAIPAGIRGAVELRTNKNGFSLGDAVYVYAPVAPTSGTFYGSAL